MKKDLRIILKTLDKTDLEELFYCMNISKEIREFKTQYELSNKRISELFNTSVYHVKNLMNGSHPYDLRIMAKWIAIKKEFKENELRELRSKQIKCEGYSYFDLSNECPYQFIA